MKYNKAKWIGTCKVVSVLGGGLFELSYEVNGKFIKYDCKHPQLLKRFCGEPLSYYVKIIGKLLFASSVVFCQTFLIGR